MADEQDQAPKGDTTLFPYPNHQINSAINPETGADPVDDEHVEQLGTGMAYGGSAEVGGTTPGNQKLNPLVSDSTIVGEPDPTVPDRTEMNQMAEEMDDAHTGDDAVPTAGAGVAGRPADIG